MRMTRIVDTPEFNIGLFALLINLPWEIAQMPLYAGSAALSHAQGNAICAAATVGDAIITLLAFGVIDLLARSRAWVRAPRRPQVAGFILVCVVLTILIEIAATHSNNGAGWRYAPIMPMIGVAPLLQWALLPLLVLWIVRRQIGPRWTMPARM